MKERKITTLRGIGCRVREAGEGAPLVYFHGAGGLYPEEQMLDSLAQRFHVFAPEWPGYGLETTEESIEDMLDFALHGWDVVDALDLGRVPHLVGHSMGAMIAAEMACIAPHALSRLALISPLGLWIDAEPIPDIFAMLPFELASAMFADPKAGEAFLTGGLDFSDNDALTNFMVQNARRLGTAGKILFPIPNRRLSKRLYRCTAPTQLVWGRNDGLVPPVYAEKWQGAIAGAELTWVANAGHMAPYEQPAAVSAAVSAFLAEASGAH